MKKTILIITAILLTSTIGLKAQVEDEIKYHRSSIYSLMVEHESQKFAYEIAREFINMPVPDKYNDHDLSVKVVSVDTKKVKEDEIEDFLNRNGVASRLVAKWFDRDFTNGVCNVDLVRERGLYNASEMDKAVARQSIRGKAMLEDAGEELIGNTFVIVSDIRYVDKSKGSKIFGGVVRFVGAVGAAYTGKTEYATAGDLVGDIAESYKGFKVKVFTYLYQLVWDDDTAGEFYRYMYTDAPDEEKRAYMESHRDVFKLKYIGKQESSGSTTSFLGIKEDQPEMMVRKACQRALDDNVADLQKNFDEFKVKVPLLTTEPYTAQIGKKEGITGKSKFEVLEVMEKDGRTEYKRVGVIKPIEDRIWDNRFMAAEERAEGANLGFTTFKKVSGGKFYPGMLIREIR